MSPLDQPLLPPSPARLPTPRPGLRAWLGTLVSIVLFGGVLYLMALTVPEIVHDWQIRDTAQPVANGRIEDGRCHRRMGFLVECSATLHADLKQVGSVSRSVSHYFTDWHSGDYTASIMADPAHPEWLTTDIGLEHLLSRSLTVAFFGLCVAGFVASRLLRLARLVRG